MWFANSFAKHLGKVSPFEKSTRSLHIYSRSIIITFALLHFIKITFVCVVHAHTHTRTLCVKIRNPNLRLEFVAIYPRKRSVFFPPSAQIKMPLCSSPT